MKHPLSNCTQFSRWECFHQLRKEKILAFVRPTGHWMDLWTNVYGKEIFPQVGCIPKWNDRSGRCKYKWTCLDQSTVWQSWFQTLLPILASSIIPWGSFPFIIYSLREFRFRGGIVFRLLSISSLPSATASTSPWEMTKNTHLIALLWDMLLYHRNVEGIPLPWYNTYFNHTVRNYYCTALRF